MNASVCTTGGDRMKFIIVDDERDICELLASMLALQYPDSETEFFTNVPDAVTKLEDLQDPTDIIIFTDWRIKSHLGSEVIQAAQQAGVPPERIVVMSGLDFSAAKELSGAQHLLKKPFHFQEEVVPLIELIQSVRV